MLLKYAIQPISAYSQWKVIVGVSLIIETLYQEEQIAKKCLKRMKNKISLKIRLAVCHWQYYTGSVLGLWLGRAYDY